VAASRSTNRRLSAFAALLFSLVFVMGCAAISATQTPAAADQPRATATNPPPPASTATASAPVVARADPTPTGVPTVTAAPAPSPTRPATVAPAATSAPTPTAAIRIAAGTEPYVARSPEPRAYRGLPQGVTAGGFPYVGSPTAPGLLIDYSDFL